MLAQSLQMQRVMPPTLGFTEVPERHVHEAVGPELVCGGYGGREERRGASWSFMERHIASWSVMHPWQSLREGQQESEALGTEERRGEAMTGLRGRQEPSLAHGIESSVQVSNGKKSVSWSSIERSHRISPSNVMRELS